jgi:hypothetical protein
MQKSEGCTRSSTRSSELGCQSLALSSTPSSRLAAAMRSSGVSVSDSQLGGKQDAYMRRDMSKITVLDFLPVGQFARLAMPQIPQAHIVSTWSLARFPHWSIVLVWRDHFAWSTTLVCSTKRKRGKQIWSRAAMVVGEFSTRRGTKIFQHNTPNRECLRVTS